METFIEAWNLICDYLKNQIEENIAMLHETTDTASNQTFYKAAAKTVNDILIERSKHFQAQAAIKII